MFRDVVFYVTLCLDGLIILAFFYLLYKLAKIWGNVTRSKK